MKSQDETRIVELTGLLFDEIITAEQAEELNGLLSLGVEQREVYRVTLSVLQNLQSDAFVNAEDHQDQGVSATHSSSNTVTPQRRRVVPRLLVAALLIAGLVPLLFLRQSAAPSPSALARVVDGWDVTWQSATDVREDDSELVSGDQLKVESGVLTVAFEHGVETTIEGPAVVTVDNRDQLTLHHGRLAAWVPEEAIGFRVMTPSAEVVDLGTEFGVQVVESGQAEVHVFEGEVEVSPRGATEPDVVLAGASRAVDPQGRVQAGTVNEQRFVATRDALHRRWIVRNGFKTGNGTKYDSQFPGRGQLTGWAGPWKVSVDGEGATHTASVVTGSVGELLPGSDQRLQIEAQSGDVAARLRVRRDLRLPVDIPWDDQVFVDFLMRIDSDSASVARMQLLGTGTADQDGRSVVLWEMYTEKNKHGQSIWTAGGIREPPVEFLPLSSQQTCRYMLKYIVGKPKWHAVLIQGDDQRQSYVMRDTPRVLPHLHDKVSLNWEVDIPPQQAFRMSLDSIRIHTRPSGPPPDSRSRLEQL